MCICTYQRNTEMSSLFPCLVLMVVLLIKEFECHSITDCIVLMLLCLSNNIKLTLILLDTGLDMLIR